MKNKKQWDEEFEEYKQTMQLGTCPADPGPERDEWRIKRLYFACRLLTERVETEAPPHLCAHASALVGLATRQAGWAAMEGAWREATQEVFDQARMFSNDDANPMLLESEMTHYNIQVTGRWANDDKEFTGVRNVVFSARLK